MQRHATTAAYNFSLSVAGIYAIVRKGTTDCYVGQSVDIRKRWVTHRQDFKKNRHASKFMQRVYNKHGADVFEFKILQIGMDPEDQAALITAEMAWIRDLQPIYNTAPVAGSCYGLKQSPETCAKRSLAMMGNTNAADSGWVMSAEQRQNASLRMMGNQFALGYTASEEKKKTQSLKMMGNQFALGHSSPKKGVPRTNEEKKNISLGKLGIKQTEAHRLAKSKGMLAYWAEQRRLKAEGPSL